MCARCTGELAGIAAGLCLCAFWLPPLWLTLMLMLPMIVDGLVQLRTAYESTNLRRVITGGLFGWGLVGFLWVTGRMFYQFGYGLMQ